MTRFQRASWLAVLLVTLVAFGLMIPRLPAWGDDSKTLEVDTEVGMATAAVTIPAGWALDIAAASQQIPVASRNGVEVTIMDAVWLGDSSDLLGNVADLLFDGDAVIPDVTAQADAPAGGTPLREVWQLAATPAASDDAPVRVDVIRDGQGVVLVAARGAESDVTALSDAIDAMSDSVQLDLSALDVRANT